MDSDTLTTFEKFIEWAGTPWGRVTLQGLSVFIFCEFFVRMPLMKGLKVFSKVSKLKREFIADTIGIFTNLATGVFIALLIHWGEALIHIIFQSWYLIIIAMLAHIIYIRYLDKYIKKKYGID